MRVAFVLRVFRPVTCRWFCCSDYFKIKFVGRGGGSCFCYGLKVGLMEAKG